MPEKQAKKLGQHKLAHKTSPLATLPIFCNTISNKISGYQHLKPILISTI